MLLLGSATAMLPAATKTTHGADRTPSQMIFSTSLLKAMARVDPATVAREDSVTASGNVTTTWLRKMTAGA